ncbi:hypothetical protein H072_6273 [Dactylellina haptotyla CBS 200.50]|uniref:Uncharacterized protein n=1 Tax=Dactylellina haptotyla (strain CBS 200.50) TaxID=1284197 RepID=S8AFD7_DACHA|nr:hypothetical protein H072_6273 [Dactylellina haptotyla CBS 200.50]
MKNSAFATPSIFGICSAIAYIWLVSLSAVVAPGGEFSQDTQVSVPIRSWQNYRRGSSPLLDQILAQLKLLRQAREDCPVGSIDREGPGEDIDDPRNGFNILRLALKNVSQKMKYAILGNSPSEVGFTTIEEIQPIKMRLDGFRDVLIAMEQDHVLAFDDISKINDMNGFQYVRWLWSCTPNMESMVFICDDDGKRKRIRELEELYETVTPSIQLLQDAADWASTNGLVQNQALNKILAYYNPDTTVTTIKFPNIRGVDYGVPAGSTSYKFDLKDFDLRQVFERLEIWFDCWRAPLPELITLTNQLPPLPKVEAQEPVKPEVSILPVLQPSVIQAAILPQESQMYIL